MWSQRLVLDKATSWVAIALSVIAIAFAAYSLGALSMMPHVTEAQMRAATAEASKDMQQQVADAKANAALARTQALVAVDKVEDVRTKLASKGIELPPLDGH
jgi:hypothetical protein